MNMKKWMMLLLSTALVLPSAACGTDPAAEDTTIGTEAVAEDSGLEDNLEHSGEMVEIPNPWTEYETLAQACEESGFDMTAPDAIEGYEEQYISAIKGEIIQVNFSRADGAYITFRKGIGDADISGDYNTYAVSTQQEIGDKSVTLKGNDETISLVTWTDGTYSYSVNSNPGLDADTMTALAEGLQ